MQPTTYLTLAGYTFAGFGVPERVNGGGEHRLVVHKFLGGVRVIDAMGPDDDPIQWKGTFRSLDGYDPMTQVAYLNAIRSAGKPVTLTYWNQTYQVVVRSFRWQFARFHEVDFDLVCEVLVDPSLAAAGGGITQDAAVGGDLGLAGTLAEGSVITADELIAASLAYAQYGPLANATASGALAITSSVTASIAGLTNIAATADISLGTAGGVVVGMNPVAMVASLTAQAAIMTDGAAAQNTLPVMVRVNLNLSAPAGRIVAD